MIYRACFKISNGEIIGYELQEERSDDVWENVKKSLDMNREAGFTYNGYKYFWVFVEVEVP